MDAPSAESADGNLSRQPDCQSGAPLARHLWCGFPEVTARLCRAAGAKPAPSDWCG
jgi:hypothetical protein